MREEAPVAFSPELDSWVVTTYDLCMAVLKDPASFRQWNGNEMHAPDNGPPYGNPENWNPGVRQVMDGAVMPVSTLVTSNPPRHTRYRKLAMSLFSARRTAELMETDIQTIIDDAIDKFEGGRIDFINAFALPLPTQVVAGILRVPAELYPSFADWAEASVMTSAGRETSPEQMVEYAKRIVAFQEFFIARLDERRAKPGEDVVSFLANAEVDDDDGEPRPLNVSEQLGLLLHFVTAGSETTTNLLGSVMNRVLSEPGLADRLREQPDALPGVVEETLRSEGPVQGLFRHTVRDVELGGVTIPANQKVLVFLGSANRDSARFLDGESYDVDRDDLRGHVAFGFGTHFCLGAPLARKETAMAVETLLRRLPDLRLDGDTSDLRYHQVLFYGFTSLPLAYDTKLEASATTQSPPLP